MGFWSTIGDIGKAVTPFLGPIGGVASTIIDAASQSHANKSNQDFAAQQSGTQYQRGVADMQAAGLNPALAYGGAKDNSATSQVQPTFSNTPSKLATALDTYNTFATSNAQRELLNSQTDAANAQAQKARVDAATEAPLAILGQDADYISKNTAAARAEATQRAQQAANYPQLFGLDVATKRAGIANTTANTGTANALSKYYQTQSRLNEQQFTNEFWNKNISPYINSSAQAIKAFTPALKLFP